MNPATYIPIIVLWIIVLWIILFVMFRGKRRAVIIRKIIEKRKRGGNTEMKELAGRFIEKECIIYSLDASHQYEGIIREVTEGAILIEKDGKLEAINLDYVTRIREYPRNKNGKKKSVVLD